MQRLLGRSATGAFFAASVLILLPTLFAGALPRSETGKSVGLDSMASRVLPLTSSAIPTNLSLTRAGYLFVGSISGTSPGEGSWFAPRFQGTCSATSSHETAYVAVGEALRANASFMTAQAGTAVECNAGRVSYFAWYEFGSRPVQRLNMSFSPGDLMRVGVVNNASRFWMDDRSTGGYSGYISGPTQVSAPAVLAYLVERPLVNGTPTPLPDFGQVRFVNCSAPISGAGTPTSDVMTNGGAGSVVARLTPLKSSAGAFNVVWV